MIDVEKYLTEPEKSYKGRKSMASEGGKGITIHDAERASKDACILVEYTVAIVEYAHLYRPLRTARDKLKELEQEITRLQLTEEVKKQEVCSLCLQLQEAKYRVFSVE